MSVLSLALHHSAVSESWNETVILHSTSPHEDSVWLLYFWYFLSDYHRQQDFVFLWELRTWKMWVGKGAVTVLLHANPLSLNIPSTYIHGCYISPPSACAAVLVFFIFLSLDVEWETVSQVSSGNHIYKNCFTSLPTFSGRTLMLLPLAAMATQIPTPPVTFTFHPFQFTT